MDAKNILSETCFYIPGLTFYGNHYSGQISSRPQITDFPQKVAFRQIIAWWLRVIRTGFVFATSLV